MKKILVIFIFISFSQLLKAQNLNSLFRDACDLFNRKEYILCYSYMKQIADSDITFKEAYYYKAKILFLMNEDSLSLINLNIALSQDKNYIDALILRSAVFLNLRKMTLSINDADRAVELSPSNPKAYVQRGLVKGEIEIDGGFMDFEKAKALYIKRAEEKKQSGDI
jgi:tetratricopeptide (TPR) repeat protein